ncbi:hypothetical protein EVG20_g5376 [Dentipellis fragilis]|uniref:Uncharacterized protein n=1 Tax=Dentipellis fragilis TaxID=205917 RepID=A0A4Y9YVM0_9AGAM|nr:hypothetical protein EVG20_g5376 [Dentipellis fragilis]
MPWNPDFDDPDAALRVSYTAHPDDSCLFGAQALCSVLPFAGVHTVSLAAFSRLRKAGISDSDIGGGGGETVSVDWMAVLRCMPGVRTLELVRYAVGDVLQDIADYARRMSLRPGSGSVDDRDWGVPLLKFALPAVERMVLVQPETDFCVAEDPKRVLGLLSLLLRGLGEPKSVPKSVTVDARETASSLEEIVLSRFVDLEESDVDDLRKHVRRVVIRG